MPSLIENNESPLTPTNSPGMIVSNGEQWARAVRIPFQPTTVGDWADPDPTNVREALDDLAGANLSSHALVNMVAIQSA